MSNHYVSPKYDQTVVPGQVKHVKTNGKVDVGNHINGGYSLTPAPYRSFVGSPVSGFHGAPNVNDNVAILYGPNNRPLAIVPILSPDNTLKVVMPSLNPGESGQYHKDGRVADLLPNSGGATIYSDPAHSVSLIASAIGFVLTGILSILNLIVTGTLSVTGLSTLTGGATVGNSVFMNTHPLVNSGTISMATSSAVVLDNTSGLVVGSNGLVLQSCPITTGAGPVGGSATTLPAKPAFYFKINIPGLFGWVPVY